MHTSRYRGCDLSLSSHSLTANQGGAECHHCGHPQQNRCEASAPPHPNHAKGPDLVGTKFAGARTHRQTGTNSMQYANASIGVTPQQMHTSQGYTQEPRLPTGPRPDTLTHTRQAEALELRCPGKVHGPPPYHIPVHINITIEVCRCKVYIEMYTSPRKYTLLSSALRRHVINS